MQIPKRNATTTMALKSCTRLSTRFLTTRLPTFFLRGNVYATIFTRVVSDCWNTRTGMNWIRDKNVKLNCWDWKRFWEAVVDCFIRFYIIVFFWWCSVNWFWIYEINIWEMRICIESLIWNNIFNSFLTVWRCDTSATWSLTIIT